MIIIYRNQCALLQPSYWGAKSMSTGAQEYGEGYDEKKKHSASWCGSITGTRGDWSVVATRLEVAKDEEESALVQRLKPWIWIPTMLLYTWENQVRILAWLSNVQYQFEAPANEEGHSRTGVRRKSSFTFIPTYHSFVINFLQDIDLNLRINLIIFRQGIDGFHEVGSIVKHNLHFSEKRLDIGSLFHAE